MAYYKADTENHKGESVETAYLFYPESLGNYLKEKKVVAQHPGDKQIITIVTCPNIK